MFSNSLVTLAAASYLLLSSQALAAIPTAFTSGFNPASIQLVVNYDGKEITDGESLSNSQTSKVPSFALGDSSGISTVARYVVLMIDPDSPSPDDADAPQVLHYLCTDFQVTEGTMIASESSPSMAYAGPDASTGSGEHRYIFLMYRQPSGFSVQGVPDAGSRAGFDVAAWREMNGLRAAVAGIHFVATPGGGGGGGAGAAPGTSGSAPPMATETTKSEAPTPPVASSPTPIVSTPPIAGTTPPVETTPALNIGQPVPTPSSPASGAVQTHKVTVGGPGLLKYTPEWITANPGDIVTFDFLARNHTVTQSTLDLPCVFKADGGVKSGFRPNPDNVSGKSMFEYTVPDSKPQWFFCAQGTHCQAGMVFAVNPGEKFPLFLANAKAATGPGTAPPAAATSNGGLPTITLVPVPTGTGSAAAPSGNGTVTGQPPVEVFPGAGARLGASKVVVAGVVGLVGLVVVLV